VSVDAARNAAAKRVIDASGKIVAPGFIDPHTHATRYLRRPDTAANLNYLMQGVTTVVIGSDGYGVPGGQDTLASFESQGIGPNVAFLAGHGQVRKATMGLADRAANDSELLAMQALVEETMQAGAIGLSTGLYYAPGSYAETSEVVELAKVAAAYGGVYDTHMRSEGSQGSGVIDALDEAISIGRDAGIPVHISHIKALGKDSWQHSQSLIDRIEAARADGLSVTANQYPWRASGTRFSSALIPRWVLADSEEHMRERLTDPDLQPRILAEMRTNLERRGGADAMLVTHADSPYTGMTLTQIAAQLQIEPVRAAIEVVLQGDPSIASFVMQQDSIEQLAVKPWVMTGSDGSSGHPRLYGTYPKAWRDFVVDKPLMTAEQFIHRSSGLTADTLGLCRRGYLRTGYLADVAIFDPQSFRPNADYQNPTKLASGVSQVLVNGVVVIDGEHTEALPGRVLRKTGC
jgi:N-acyl-D-aspartate/D-glutamate deacylase